MWGSCASHQASATTFAAQINKKRVGFLALELIDNRCPSRSKYFLRNTLKTYALYEPKEVDPNVEGVDVTQTLKDIDAGRMKYADGKVMGVGTKPSYGRRLLVSASL